MALRLRLRASDPAAVGDASTLTTGAVTAPRNRVAMIFGLLALVALAVPFGILCFTIAVSPGPVYLGGDNALVALATRAAAGWHQLLGPYSRFGWFHPGPAYFYLQSLPSHALVSGQSQFFGNAAINSVAGLLCVATVWRRVGHRAALWTTICVAFLALALTPAPLRTPWNPFALAFPICLLAILCAAAATGSRLCLLAALLVGSYLVQTDIGTAPVVLVLVLAASVVCLLANRTGVGGAGPRAWPRWPAAALAAVGTATLLVMWVPPLIQEARGNPGNLTLLWRFFTAGHPQHSLGEALRAAGTTDSLLGFRNVGSDPLQGSHYLALVVALLVGVATVALALWRRHRFGLGLGVASLVGQAVSIAAITRVVGPIYGYLLQWEAALPVVAAIGLGVVLLGEQSPEVADGGARRRRAAALARGRLAVAVALGLGAVAVASVLAARVAQLPPVSSLSAADVGQAWKLVAPQLRPGDTSILVDVRSVNAWPLAVGLGDQLDLRKVHPTFPGDTARTFGTSVVTGREPAVVAVYLRELAPPTPPVGYRYLGTAGDGVLYFWQQPSIH